MGNNAAYTTFEHTIITLYDKGVLDLDLLDTLAKEYAGSDIDSGGSRNLKTKDGKDLETVCIELVDPGWKSESEVESDDYWDERYDKWDEVQGRWHW